MTHITSYALPKEIKLFLQGSIPQKQKEIFFNEVSAEIKLTLEYFNEICFFFEDTIIVAQYVPDTKKINLKVTPVSNTHKALTIIKQSVSINENSLIIKKDSPLKFQVHFNLRSIVKNLIKNNILPCDLDMYVNNMLNDFTKKDTINQNLKKIIPDSEKSAFRVLKTKICKELRDAMQQIHFDNYMRSFNKKAYISKYLQSEKSIKELHDWYIQSNIEFSRQKLLTQGIPSENWGVLQIQNFFRDIIGTYYTNIEVFKTRLSSNNFNPLIKKVKLSQLSKMADIQDYSKYKIKLLPTDVKKLGYGGIKLYFQEALKAYSIKIEQETREFVGEKNVMIFFIKQFSHSGNFNLTKTNLLNWIKYMEWILSEEKNEKHNLFRTEEIRIDNLTALPNHKRQAFIKFRKACYGILKYKIINDLIIKQLIEKNYPLIYKNGLIPSFDISYQSQRRLWKRILHNLIHHTVVKLSKDQPDNSQVQILKDLISSKIRFDKLIANQDIQTILIQTKALKPGWQIWITTHFKSFQEFLAKIITPAIQMYKTKPVFKFIINMASCLIAGWIVEQLIFAAILPLIPILFEKFISKKFKDQDKTDLKTDNEVIFDILIKRGLTKQEIFTHLYLLGNQMGVYQDHSKDYSNSITAVQEMIISSVKAQKQISSPNNKFNSQDVTKNLISLLQHIQKKSGLNQIQLPSFIHPATTDQAPFLVDYEKNELNTKFGKQINNIAKIGLNDFYNGVFNMISNANSQNIPDSIKNIFDALIPDKYTIKSNPKKFKLYAFVILDRIKTHKKLSHLSLENLKNILSHSSFIQDISETGLKSAIAILNSYVYKSELDSSIKFDQATQCLEYISALFIKKGFNLKEKELLILCKNILAIYQFGQKKEENTKKEVILEIAFEQIKNEIREDQRLKPLFKKNISLDNIIDREMFNQIRTRLRNNKLEFTYENIKKSFQSPIQKLSLQKSYFINPVHFNETNSKRIKLIINNIIDRNMKTLFETIQTPLILKKTISSPYLKLKNFPFQDVKIQDVPLSELLAQLNLFNSVSRYQKINKPSITISAQDKNLIDLIVNEYLTKMLNIRGNLPGLEDLPKPSMELLQMDKNSLLAKKFHKLFSIKFHENGKKYKFITKWSNASLDFKTVFLKKLYMEAVKKILKQESGLLYASLKKELNLYDGQTISFLLLKAKENEPQAFEKIKTFIKSKYFEKLTFLEIPNFDPFSSLFDDKTNKYIAELIDSLIIQNRKDISIPKHARFEFGHMLINNLQLPKIISFFHNLSIQVIKDNILSMLFLDNVTMEKRVLATIEGFQFHAPSPLEEMTRHVSQILDAALKNIAIEIKTFSLLPERSPSTRKSA
ncbi:hypothetical protein LDC_1266 [sediment metagenome]|uniref:Uncharacterized protein n=1 Tax=sediment metagenome TaxID=749907 RepID=D9PIB0_9ZZZZ